MDGVEIVMAVEDRFGIAIEDAEAEQIRTPGQLIDLVSSKVAVASVAGCRTQRAFHAIRRIFHDKFGCDRKDIRPEIDLDVLIPRVSRFKVWRGLQHDCRAMNWPDLSYSRIALSGMFGCSAAVFFASKQIGMDQLFNSLAGFVALTLLFKTLKPLRTVFCRIRTVGDLAHFVAGQAPKLFDPDHGWSRAEVAFGVREIVIEQLCCNNYREDADFVKDLGMG